MVKDKWMKLWIYLTTTYRDGVMVKEAKPGLDHGGKMMGGPVGVVVEGSGQGNSEWPDQWKKSIVESTGDHFKIITSEEAYIQRKWNEVGHLLLKKDLDKLEKDAEQLQKDTPVDADFKPAVDRAAHLAKKLQVVSGKNKQTPPVTKSMVESMKESLEKIFV